MFGGRARTSLPESRVLRGVDNWWFLGPGGVAKLKSWHLGENGEPSADTVEWLHSNNMYRTPKRKLYSLTVLTTTHCNLGCAYCFQNLEQDESGGTAPPRISYSRLTSATISKILDFTRNRMSQAGLSGLQVTLFGGEPLLNPRGCTELLEAAAPLGLRWADMVSNGTVLNGALIKPLNALGLRSIQITFDGDQPDHDVSRVKRTGGGTFSTIVSNIGDVLDKTDMRFVFRVNVTNQNIQGMERLVARLSERLDVSRCTIYFKVVGDFGTGFQNDMTGSSDLAQRFIDAYRCALEHGFLVARPREPMECPACSFVGGTYGAVANADGSLASCWETAGRPEWQVGTVDGGYDPQEAITPRWTSCEEQYLNFSDQEWWDSFYHKVDATLLDDLAALQRL